MNDMPHARKAASTNGMKLMTAWRAVPAAAALNLLASAVLAQGQAIPPPHHAANDKRAQDARQAGMVDAVVALPGQIVKGGAMLQQAQGIGGAYRTLAEGEIVGRNFGRVMDGAKLWDSYSRGGQQAVFGTAFQMGLDKSVQHGVESAVVKSLVRRAVVGGVGGALATGGASIAFEGGVIVGSVLRDNITINNKLLGDHVDDFYFGIAPDALKEAVSGTRQVDLDSAEFQQQMQQDVDRRRRAAAFQRVQTEMAQQREQSAQHAAAQAATQAAQQLAQAPQTSPDPGLAWLDAMNQSLAAQQRSTPALKKANCQLDPRTGCHPGHDEKSHPGGCKIC